MNHLDVRVMLDYILNFERMNRDDKRELWEHTGECEECNKQIDAWRNGLRDLIIETIKESL